MKYCKRLTDHIYIEVITSKWNDLFEQYKVYPSCSCGWEDPFWLYSYSSFCKAYWEDAHIDPLNKLP